MKTTRTKRAPASQSLEARATQGPNETPKGSGPSVPPGRSVRLTQADLNRYARPLAERYWAFRRPGEPRVRPGLGPLPAVEPLLETDPDDVHGNWAVLSGWAPQPVYFAKKVPLEGLRRRFPFARPRTVAGVIRLLMLHELAHHAKSHSGISVSMDHWGTREELRAKFAEMEREADDLTVIFWRKGLTRRTVPRYVQRPAGPRMTLCGERAAEREANA